MKRVELKLQPEKWMIAKVILTKTVTYNEPIISQWRFAICWPQ